MKSAIEDNELNLTIKFFNTFEADDEKVAKEYYESRGYEAINTSNKKTLKKIIDGKFSNTSLRKIDLNDNGIPDFLVFNKPEYFFVEAKSGSYSLKQNQIEWMIKYKERVVIFWLRKPKYNIYFDMVSE